MPAMSTFAVIAHRFTPTNTRLGTVLSPAQALARLGPGDVALGRLDVLPTLDGIEPGLWALDRLDARGVTVLNGPRTLVAAHDKLTTAQALFGAGVPHPRTVHVAPWLRCPSSSRRSSSSLASGRGVRTSSGATTQESIERTLADPRDETVVRGDRRRSRRSSSRRAATTCGWSSPATESSARSRASRRRANGGRTSRSARGASRSTRRATRATIALAAAARDRRRPRRHRPAAGRGRHVGRARGERRRRLQRAPIRWTTTSSPHASAALVAAPASRAPRWSSVRVEPAA